MRFYYQSPLPQLPSGRGRNHRRHTNDHHRHPSPMIYRPPSYAHARWNETHPYPQDQPHAMSSIPYFEGSYFEHNYTNSNNLQQSDSHTNTKVTRSTHHLLPPPIQRCHQPPSTIKAPIFVPGPNTTHFPLLPLSAHRPSTDGMQYHHNNLYPSYPNIKEDCSMIIDDVRETDVLCGRGAPSQYHAGNTHFQQLVNRFQSSYIAARRLDKPEIAMHLVHVVRNRGGRFLKRTKLPGLGPSGHFGWYVLALTSEFRIVSFKQITGCI